MPEPQPPDSPLLKFDAIIERLERHLPADNPPLSKPAPLALNCPKCHQPMQPGEASFDGDWESYLIYGLSGEDGSFRALAGGEKSVFLPSRGKRRACRCARCGLVVIEE